MSILFFCRKGEGEIEMNELIRRLVEPYLADFEKDWVDKVDPLEIKKVIEEMQKELEFPRIHSHRSHRHKGEYVKTTSFLDEDIEEFKTKLQKWLGK